MREQQWRSKPHTKPLRQNMTKAEIVLWSKLKSRQLNGHKFRRQHPIDDYVTDFACINAKLVIEIDGSIHQSDDAIERDGMRTETLRALGWVVIRFSNEDVLHRTNKVLHDISLRLPPPSR